ncbi:hypothetical protein [Paludibacterium paludis]|uniref:Uncharacterized protein n=1 Tax=Paludibacterium paludis TaxID=1225769 RepID=A0A918P570_9NEIS|nr:hypothetical protein [Paludibacterium paludis]GGY20751.1 hypothetical protein GCM10011289_25480 [Paludibacterium paludis]
MNFLYATGISGLVLCIALIISGAISQRGLATAHLNAVTAREQALVSGFQTVLDGYEEWVNNDVNGQAAGIATADTATQTKLAGRLADACAHESESLAPGQLPGGQAVCHLPNIVPGDLGWTTQAYPGLDGVTAKIFFYAAIKPGSGVPDAAALIAALKPKLEQNLFAGIYDPDRDTLTDPTADPASDPASATYPHALPATLTAQFQGEVRTGQSIIVIVKEYS